MNQYLTLLKDIVEHGTIRKDRTGVGTIGIFGAQMRFDLSEGFPAVTTKKLAFKAVLSELLWFIEGSGDENRLKEILHGDRNSSKPTVWTGNANANYWTPKAKFQGDLGRIYGVNWRAWRTPLFDESGNLTGYKETDQLLGLIEGIKKDPYGRRHILTAWNVGELDQMALPPCHVLAQFYVADGKLSCQLYQRSMDTFLGCPFNIASYALLTHMVAQVCGLKVGDFVHTVGDAHVYLNHLEAVHTQLAREPKSLPTLWMNPDITDITEFTMNDFKLVDYHPHEAIPALMAV